MAGTPELFVVCRHCGHEVSPYITECPYCGQRLRKRAPRIERDVEGGARPKVRKIPQPSLGRLRTGEIPGIRGDELARPWATITLVALGAVGYLLLAFLNKSDIALFGPIDGEWWRVFTTPFVYDGSWYQLASLVAVGVFGWQLERRHGPLVVLLVFVLGASGGAAVAAEVQTFPRVLGGNGGALALGLAWAVPVLLARRRGEEQEGADMLGAGILLALVAAMPLATPNCDPIAALVGAGVGVLAGLVLDRLAPRTD